MSNRTFVAVVAILLLLAVGAGQGSANTKGIPNMRAMKYGFFVHYVPRITVDSHGKSIADPDTLADSFDATGFANDLKSMGVEYVIFTAWHYKMVALYPSKVMPKWLPEGHVTRRDMIGDMIKAVKANGIRVILYTHPRDGHDFEPAEQDLTGWGSGATSVDPNWKTFDFAKWNNFINEMYGELVDRYGNDIDGIYLDEGHWFGNSYKVVDYVRLRDTIKGKHPHLIMLTNYFGNLYTCDIGDLEFAGSGTFSGSDGDMWTGRRQPVAPVIGSSWVASRPSSENTVTFSPESIFRYTILQAGINTDGLGVQWATGPYSGGGWETGVMDTMRKVGEYVARISRSIKGTYPSTSYITQDGRSISYLSWGVATRSTDDKYEYIHVLKPPTSNTLRLPSPADGKTFEAARLVSNGHAVTMHQDRDELSLTLQASDAWDALDTAVELTVKGKKR